MQKEIKRELDRFFIMAAVVNIVVTAFQLYKHNYGLAVVNGFAVVALILFKIRNKKNE